MNLPLTEDARRVLSWKELFVSQMSHYYTWSGRVVSHTIAQLFLWLGKDSFNFVNAFVSVFLIAEIYWCSYKGNVSLSFETGMLWWVFFSVWAFSPDFSHIFLWLTGACNYLWTVVFLLAFLMPYVHNYYFLEEKNTHNNKWFSFVMFFFGIIAGCSNENCICWIILILLIFIYYINKRRNKIVLWMLTGVAGLIVGYLLLMLAPGNLERLLAETKGVPWITTIKIKENIAVLFLVSIFFHIFLWYFNLRSLGSLCGNERSNLELAKDVLLVKILCATSFCMSFMMIFSPTFPPRSAFPGTVLLIISSCILLRIQEEYVITLIKESAKKVLCSIGVIYFVITSVATFYGSYYTHEQILKFLAFVNSSDYNKSHVIEVNSLLTIDENVRLASCFHIMTLEMSDNANDWRNVAFSRYYGIKGIRMMKKDAEIDE